MSEKLEPGAEEENKKSILSQSIFHQNILSEILTIVSKTTFGFIYSS